MVVEATVASDRALIGLQNGVDVCSIAIGNTHFLRSASYGPLPVDSPDEGYE